MSTPGEQKRCTHSVLTEIAARNAGLPDKVRHILSVHTLEPDTWTIVQMPAHYMPFAAYIAAQAAVDARHMLTQYGDSRIGYQRLGIALHFMADCASPFHTCLFDIRAQKYHRTYEEYVAKNMFRGHCFFKALSDAAHNGAFSMYARDLAAGACHIAGLARASLSPILYLIRTDPFWEKRQDIATVTADLLVYALRMCETQIQAATAGILPGWLPALTSYNAVLYCNPLGALPFYRTYAAALLRH